MTAPLAAADPTLSAAVRASAGTGKTWLLVTRLVRLLLAGAAPGGILAVTFTRKAAAEMQDRLNARLRELALASDERLGELLEQVGLKDEPETRTRAGLLYEQLLFGAQRPRITTFHAFCQELLQRFPLEAGVPPGFELAEITGTLYEQAWAALFAEATRNPDGPLAVSLQALFGRCGSLASTRRALRSFLDHRLDWWTYVDGIDDPAGFAAREAAHVLGIDAGQRPLAALSDETTLAELRVLAGLLARDATDTSLARCERIETALAADRCPEERLQWLAAALLTQKGEPRKVRDSKALRKRLGDTDAARFVELHARFASWVLALLDAQLRLDNWHMLSDWYRAGARLLDHYQRIKREQRLLDFSDLEWHAYQLLNRSDQAHWVQYRLDARIDHLLIDEFQDTSPTQWRLVYPLLEEMAAGSDERARTVFVVGDDKQSIYGFRRADPRLLGTVDEWLATRLGAERQGLSRSWRSAPVIMDVVNRIFTQGPLADALPDFPRHTTHRKALWGAVEILPPVVAEEEAETDPPPGLRDPLTEARRGGEDQRHYEEGRQVAMRIRQLIEADTLIEDDSGIRPLCHGDIMVLLRSRSHLASYEQALREAGIPYLGAGRASLLDSLEVRDMEALLRVLVTPQDNLALAQVLRSPLFAARTEDLYPLARGQDSWMERLLRLDGAWPADHPLVRARALLPRWQTLAGQLPVHDLLDRIYHEGDVLARFDAAFPDALRPRAQANLQRFIELALETDSGRYPSLSHFLARLASLRAQDQEAPDDAPPAAGDGGRVTVLTIHGAKGLEAPVVFLMDAAPVRKDRLAWSVHLHWPTDAPRPERMLLIPPPKRRDDRFTTLLQSQVQAERREDANLLYVALTRARHYLFVSATLPRKADTSDSWYVQICQALEACETLATGKPWRLECGAPPSGPAPAPEPTGAPIAVDPRLSRPIDSTETEIEIAPSRTMHEALGAGSTDPDALTRGIAIHRLLQFMSTGTEAGTALQRVAAELALDPDDPEPRAWLAECEALLTKESLRTFFDPSCYDTAWNEVPVQYRLGPALVHGVVDRMVLSDDCVHVVDYKTHRVGEDTAAGIADAFREQLRLYGTAAARLWPAQPVRTWILFTCNGRAVELPADGPH